MPAILMLIACDGGPSDPASRDSGSDRLDAAGPPCARDSDCSDGLFCTGQERCLPGEPGSDARGCVQAEPPCALVACDEDADRCTDCPPDVADMDHDLHDSIACGGSDCDDTRPDVNRDQLEVCDAEGIDEDCNPLTWGRDADGDGAFAPDCCQRIDGALECGTDCNDGNNAIHPDAPERCNGVDDDCDGSIDEDFECIQSQPATGANACGREGTRRCSATCEWQDDAFYRAESASTCDYCDDSGFGLGEEIPFATEMREQLLADTARAFGHARRSGSNWVLADGLNQRGAVYLPTTVRIGYGDVFISTTVRSTAKVTQTCSTPLLCNYPGGWWAVVILQEGAAEFLRTTTPILPAMDRGVAAQWNFDSISTIAAFSLPDDRVQLLRLTGTGALGYGPSAIPLASTWQDGPAGTQVSHFLYLRIVPDDPRTSDVDESGLEVTALGLHLTCANNGSEPCGISFPPGSRVHVGIVAMSNSGDEIGLDAPTIRVTSNDLCGGG